ncbi:AAA family ATPase [Pseudodesulfovibrio tunisiensis]|uniref:AAA family ATPase n=1 Tax=Pseudodesulfovibrio tunisiensis TaxID=463192 RepID=UPI001FB3756C|nr:AAA family ATPase [Pseudodesulfovibrio tunisiensis]
MVARSRLNPFGDSSKNFVFFPSLSHKKGVHRIVRGLESNCGLILLTGEIGIGKTSLARYIQSYLADRFMFVELGNPYQTPLEQIFSCCAKFGLDTAGMSSIHDCVGRLEQHFHALLEQGKRPVIVFDESHLLTKRHLSLIHILSNLRAKDGPLVQILLVGQLEILDLLTTEGMEALNQRIGVRCELSPLVLEDTDKYIHFKLDKGGRTGMESFSQDAVRRIWEQCGGLPRLINHVCAHALDALAFKDSNVVTPGMVDEVCRDSVYTGLFQTRTRPKRNAGRPRLRLAWASAAAFGVLVAAFGTLWATGLLAPERLFARWEPVPAVSRVSQASASVPIPTPVKARPAAVPVAQTPAPATGAPVAVELAPVAAEKQMNAPESPMVAEFQQPAIESGTQENAVPVSVSAQIDSGAKDLVAMVQEKNGFQPSASANESEPGARTAEQEAELATAESVSESAESFADEAAGDTVEGGSGEPASEAVAADAVPSDSVVEAEPVPEVVIVLDGPVIEEPDEASQGNVPEAAEPTPSVADAEDVDAGKKAAATPRAEPEALPSEPARAVGARSLPADGTFEDGTVHPVVGGLLIGAIAWNSDPTVSIAVINSRLVHEGDDIEGVKVVSIGREDIVFEYEDQVYQRAISR